MPIGKANDKVKLNKSYTDKGVVYEAFIDNGEDRKHIVLPVSKNKGILDCIVNSEVYEQINLLEELWLQDLLFEYGEKSYYIPYNNIYDIEDELKNLLGLPIEGNFKIKLKSNRFLGHSAFNIKYELEHEEYGKLGNFYDKHGNIIEFSDKEFMLKKTEYSLIQEIDNYTETDDNNKQALFIAKVKKKAKCANAEIDSYLSNEDCYFPENVKLDVIKHNDKHLELKPYFDELDSSINSEINNLDKISKINSLVEGQKRKRVFLDDDAVNVFNAIKKNRNITGSDVPRFISTPLAFLPDSIDISQFSERVKGLKIRTYRAQPFINCSEGSSGGWFDFECGIRLDPEGIEYQEDIFNGDNKHDVCKLDLNSEEFKKLVEIAKQNGEDYVYYGDKWIKIDTQEGEKFIKANEEFNKMHPDKNANLAQIPYILDIYDNILNLEYNLTLIELKHELAKHNLLKYCNPSLLNAELYTYQKEGLQWLKLQKFRNLGGLLADDMGLGKTIQIIAFIAFLKEIDDIKPSLIVLPSALIENWENELKKFVPSIRSVYVHRGANRYRSEDIIKEYDIVLTSYEILVRDQLVLGKINWKLLVCDEVQKIKNATTLSASAVKALKSKYRVALTGTPVENGLSELWCIMDYVQPGLLRSYKWFRENFELPIQSRDCSFDLIKEKRDQLIKLINPVFLRRTKEDKLDSLPNKIEKCFNIELSRLQEEVYSKIIQKIKVEGVGSKVLAYLQQLIELCSHPRLIIGGDDTPINLLRECNKLATTIEILKEIELKEEKAIIFTKYRRMQNILRKVINAQFRCYPHCINGDIKHRVELINDFEKRKGFNVLILSPRAAGVGLNIVGANHVIHYTREWNPAVENQATDRVYRIGQNKDVIVYYPICTSKRGTTVEEKLDQLLKEKKKLVKDVIIPTEKFNISGKDFMDLFQ